MHYSEHFQILLALALDACVERLHTLALLCRLEEAVLGLDFCHIQITGWVQFLLPPSSVLYPDHSLYADFASLVVYPLPPVLFEGGCLIDVVLQL